MVLAVPLLLAGYAILQLIVPLSVPGGRVELEIPEGATFGQAANMLRKAHLIRDRNLFVLLAKVMQVDKKIRAGYYLFTEGMTPLGVFQELRKGRIIEYDVTIVEGDSLREIGAKLASKAIMPVERFNSLSADQEFLESLDISAPSLEGYLFPQTYRVSKGELSEAVLASMVSTMRSEFAGDLRERAARIGWSENQVLTLASIIEREAQTDEERPLISAVYHNRIRRGMPLQADPTAVYGVKSYKEKITLDDLRKETEYNTYVIKGLPPGPIASPGLKSITAALYPASVGYLYFVSKGDGTHYFSTTLSEHEAAIYRARSARLETTPGSAAEKQSERSGLATAGKGG